MTLPSLPVQGNTNWRGWASVVHDAVTEVTEGRLSDVELRAALVPREELPLAVTAALAADTAPAQAAAAAVTTAMAQQYLSFTLTELPRAAVSVGPTVTTSAGTVSYTTGKSGSGLAAGASLKVQRSTEGIAALKAALGFTVECWMKAPSTANGSFTYIFSNGQGNAVAIGASGRAHAAPADLPGTAVITDGNWHHVAWVANVDANGLNWTNQKVWVDGVLDITIPGTTAGSADWITTNYVGGHYNGANGLQVSVDEFRVSRGIRYTSGFTPPTRMPVDTDTISVLHLDGNTTADLGGGYPARPSGATAGTVTYVGTTQPTDWLTRDRWIAA